MIAPDFKELLSPRTAAKPDDRPIEILWVYDPQEDKVHLTDGKGDHPAHFPTHESVAPHVTHPERQEGYAFSIEGGWRISQADGHKIDDPHVFKWIMGALRHRHPAPLPVIRYHGDPNRHA